ncbi:MAG: endonuclease [Hymenobacter sp.]|nr:endonuclease [Hymenobacter sp.]
MAPFSLSAQAAVTQRINAAEDEWDTTQRHLQDGTLLQANGPQRLEQRKQRLITNTSFKNIIGPEIELELASKPLVETSMAAQRALEIFINGNDLQQCWFLTKGAELRRTVGRIHVRNDYRRIGWGTGFLVAPQLLVTNQHVLDSLATAATSWIEFDYEETYEGIPMPTAIFDLRPDVFYVSSPADGGLDYVLVAVAEQSRGDSNRPGVLLKEFGHNHLIGENGKLAKGEPIFSIQHPEGLTRQVSLRNNRLMAIDEAALEGKWMHYETDTQAGSSGAPLFNSQWQVVGIHHRAAEKRNAAGEILDVDNQPWTSATGEARKAWYANEGLRISRFLTDLKEQVRTFIAIGLPAVGVAHTITDEGKRLFDGL